MKTTIIGKNERHYICEETDRSFFASRCNRAGNVWQIEELNQKEVQGSEVLKIWGSVNETSQIAGYVKAIIDISEYAEDEKDLLIRTIERLLLFCKPMLSNAAAINNAYYVLEKMEK